MHRDPVVSINLKSVGYDARSQTLEVEFPNGAVYVYNGVPAALWEEFQAAECKGIFLQRSIRPAFTGRLQSS